MKAMQRKDVIYTENMRVLACGLSVYFDEDMNIMSIRGLSCLFCCFLNGDACRRRASDRLVRLPHDSNPDSE